MNGSAQGRTNRQADGASWLSPQFARQPKASCPSREFKSRFNTRVSPFDLVRQRHFDRRPSLGNTQAGEEKSSRGGGLRPADRQIQLQDDRRGQLGIDLVGDPDKANDPGHGRPDPRRLRQEQGSENSRGRSPPATFPKARRELVNGGGSGLRQFHERLQPRPGRALTSPASRASKGNPERARRRPFEHARAGNAGDHLLVGQIFAARLDREAAGRRGSRATASEREERRGFGSRFRSSSYWPET